MSNVEVRVGNTAPDRAHQPNMSNQTLCAPPASGNPLTVTCHGAKGRYVSVQRATSSSGTYLILCEVEVSVTRAGGLVKHIFVYHPPIFGCEAVVVNGRSGYCISIMLCYVTL